jgi:CHAD domain-containing protein
MYGEVAPMEETHERELKLQPGPDFELPDGRKPRIRTFTSTYYDTEDRRLAAAGITLRRRIENRRSLWQLKLPLGSGRRELEVAAGPSAVPSEFREPLFGVTRGRDLAEAAKLRTRRTSVEVHEDGSVVEVALDNVTVLDGRRVRDRFDELEVELLDGEENALARIGKGLRRAGASEGDWQPKVFRALGIEPPEEAAVPRDAPPLDHLAAMLSLQYEAVLQHDPGTRLGVDPEDLHKFRVATRRLRALLRAALPVLDQEWAEGLRSELSWLGSVLGPVRDLDVMLEHLRAEVTELPREEAAAGRRFVQRLRAEHGKARAAMLEALVSGRYLDLLDAIENAAQKPRAGGTQEIGLRKIAGAEFRRLRKAVRRLPPDYSDDELHAVRIKTKRARYAAELAEAAVGNKAARFVDRAKNLQDAIGEHQDAIVAEQRIRMLLETARATRTAFAGGLLVERQRARRRAAREAWPRAWRKLERSGARVWT